MNSRWKQPQIMLALVAIFALPVLGQDAKVGNLTGHAGEGKKLYRRYCVGCHGPLGDGGGMIPKRGFRKPPSYHDDRLRKAPVGYFFDVVTNGFGNMPDYSAQIEPIDRWRIIAYIRALQLSQSATVADVPPAKRGELNKKPEPQEGEGAHKAR